MLTYVSFLIWLGFQLSTSLACVEGKTVRRNDKCGGLSTIFMKISRDKRLIMCDKHENRRTVLTKGVSSCRE